jgi:hypothetical protein
MRQPQSFPEPPSNAYGFVNRRSGFQLPPPAQESSKKRTVGERFWALVDATGQGCWPWTGSKNPKGYGRCSAFGRGGLLSHRVAWALTNGDIPPGLVVRHRCHNPACCRPAHLLLGTQAENIRDSVRDHRHTFGERNGNAKLTEANVLAIREAKASGFGSTELGRRFGVTEALIRQVCKGIGWKHVAGTVAP